MESQKTQDRIQSATKAQLRKLYAHQNTDISLNATIKNMFFIHFDLSQIKTIHIFIPMPMEIDTWLIIKEIYQNFPAIKIATSICKFATCEMENFYLEADTELQTNRWGVPEPIGAEPCPNKDIDMVLLPLLAFDLQGARVGYGKGFYDRFLAKCRPDVVKIGLSKHQPIEKITDTNQYDIGLDYCIAADKIWKF